MQEERRRSDSSGRVDSLLRLVVATTAAVDIGAFPNLIGQARRAAEARGDAIGPLVDLLSGSPVLWLLTVGGLAAAIAFGRRPGRIFEGLATLATLAVMNTVHAQLFGSPWRHLYYSGLCLSGWTLGLIVSRRAGAPDDESHARYGATALLAAAYLNAGLSKLAYGGLDWVSGLPIQAVVLGQDGMVPDGLLATYRTWLVNSPLAAGLFSVLTVVFELAGPLMLAGPRARRFVALGLLAMHGNILLLTAILYWQAIVMLVSFGLAPESVYPSLDPRLFLLTHRRRFRMVCASIILIAAASILHQRHRHQTDLGLVDNPTSPPPVASGHKNENGAGAVAPELWRLGPFTVGDKLGNGWLITGLDTTEDGFRLMLEGNAGKVTFDISCSLLSAESPFDVGGAHLYYPRDGDLTNLAPAGQALRDRLQEVSRREDLCAAVNRWRWQAPLGGRPNAGDL